MRTQHTCGRIPYFTGLPTLYSEQRPTLMKALLRDLPTLSDREPSRRCSAKQEYLHSQPAEVWSRLRKAQPRAQRPVRAVKEKDPGAWEYSPEWMGNQGRSWGRDAGKALHALCACHVLMACLMKVAPSSMADMGCCLTFGDIWGRHQKFRLVQSPLQHRQIQ